MQTGKIMDFRAVEELQTSLEQYLGELKKKIKVRRKKLKNIRN